MLANSSGFTAGHAYQASAHYKRETLVFMNFSLQIK